MKRVFGLLLAVILCVGVLPTAASADETSTNYDGYTFNKWGTVSAGSYGSSLESLSYGYSRMSRLGDVNNGKAYTLEAAGNDQYYIRSTAWASDGIKTVYLYRFATTNDGYPYLAATSSKDNALLWTDMLPLWKTRN